ncbi:MAG: hypothetical protein IJD83_08550 [Clostridia bacterium]|nr:hypothetical protein [Clostridia bacterium]
MAARGAIIVRTFLGNEALPIADAGVHIVQRNGDEEVLLAYRTTDRNGETTPVLVDTPDAGTSESPENGTPFTKVDIRVRHPDYHRVYIHNVQVFADTQTRQLVQLIPSSERLSDNQSVEQIYITPQQL